MGELRIVPHCLLSQKPSGRDWSSARPALAKKCVFIDLSNQYGGYYSTPIQKRGESVVNHSIYRRFPPEEKGG